MNYFVYILQSQQTGAYYKGITHNLENRITEHNAGEMKSTKAYRPWRIIGYVEKPTRSEALILEKKLKNLTRKRLEEFIEKYCSR